MSNIDIYGLGGDKSSLYVVVVRGIPKRLGYSVSRNGYYSRLGYG